MENILVRGLRSSLLVVFCVALLLSCNNKLKQYEIFQGFKLGMSMEDYYNHYRLLESQGVIKEETSTKYMSPPSNFPNMRKDARYATQMQPIITHKFYEFKIGTDKFQRVTIINDFANEELRSLRLRFTKNSGSSSSLLNDDEISKNYFSEILNIYTLKYGKPKSEIDNLSQSYTWKKGNLVIQIRGQNFESDKLKNAEIEYQFDENYSKKRDEEIEKNRIKEKLRDI